MNRFRPNLHPSFFDPEAKEQRETPEDGAQVLKDSKEKQDALAESIVQEPNFSNIYWRALSEASSQYTDMDQLKADRTRFISRVQATNSTWENYGQVWEKKLKDWYTKLLNKLDEKNYFKDLGEAEKKEKARSVATTYFNEAKAQYKKNIWETNNDQFDQIKDTIFDADDANSPYNRAYQSITWLGGSRDRDNVQWYDSEILYGPEAQWDGESQKEINNRKFLSKELPNYLWELRKKPFITSLLKWVPGFVSKIDKPSEEDKNAINKFVKVATKLEMSDSNSKKDVAVALLEAFQYNGLIKGDRSSYETALNRAWIKVDDKVKDKYKKDIMKAWDFFISTQNYENWPREQHAIYLGIMEIIKTEGWIQAAVNKFRSVVEEAKDEKKREKKEWYATGEKLDSLEGGADFKEFAKKLWITDYTSATRLFLLKQGQEQSEEEVAATGPALQPENAGQKDKAWTIDTEITQPVTGEVETPATWTATSAQPEVTTVEAWLIPITREKYFSTAGVWKILANLNNDNTIDARDSFAWWTKSWKQFLDVFNQIGERTALPNLLERAKLENNVMWLGLDNNEFTEKEITSWNIKLILLLQNIINKPGEDLYTLLSGHKEDPFEWVSFEKAKQDAEDRAQKMFSKDTIEKWRQEWLDLPKAEDLQTGLAATLYTEYSKWVWLGSKISFDQWIQWVGLNFGLQVRDNDVVAWIGLDYSKQIDLWKWWSTTPWLAAGWFFPIWSWKPRASISAKNEIANERTNRFWTLQHMWVDMGVTLLSAGITVLSGWLNWSRDKLALVESEAGKKREEFVGVMQSILTDLEQNISAVDWKKVLDFSSDGVVAELKGLIETKAKESWVKAEELENVVNATMRLLLPYNGADLSNDWVREAISQWVANQYAIAWAEDRKAHVSDKTYLSWASLGAFWVAGTPLVWIYGWLKWTTHHADGYGDRQWNTQEIHQEYQWEWNEGLLNNLNKELWLTKPEEKLTISADKHYVKIPEAIHRRVLVNEKMQWLMKKDGKDVLIDTHTPMATDIRRWAATRNTDLIIWWKGWNENEYVPLDVAITRSEEWFDWFTNGEIDTNSVLELWWGIESYNADMLTKALNELKNKLPSDEKLKEFNFTEVQVTNLVAKLNALKEENANKKQKIVLENKDGAVTLEGDPVVWDEGKWLEIEYRANYEMINPKAKEIAKKVYERAASTKVNLQKLYAVKHPNPSTQYNDFIEHIKNGKYQEAKTTVENILKNIWFDTTVLNWPDQSDWNEALVQSLYSINNLFARSLRVVWKWQTAAWINEYSFTTNMWAIIADREWKDGGWNKKKWGITETIKTKWDIPQNVRDAYVKLIQASSTYRQATGLFEKRRAKAAQLQNTVWFNLWDKTNPENPLFNPEIYEDMVDFSHTSIKDIEGLSEAKNTIHKRAMEQFAKNDALINPILKVLWLEGKTVEIDPTSRKVNMQDPEKREVTLDIWDKKVTLSAWMKFGYFTQCVNHTVILNDITIVGEDGNTVNFNSWVWEDGTYVEGNRTTNTSTITLAFNGAGTITGSWWDAHTAQGWWQENLSWTPTWWSGNWSWLSSWGMQDK